MRTNILIENITFNEDGITRIVKNLNPRKSLGLYNLAIRMIKFVVSPSLIH